MYLMNFLTKRIGSSESERTLNKSPIKIQTKREGPFDLDLVIEVAKNHPFYTPERLYPLSQTEIAKLIARTRTRLDIDLLLSSFPITQKQHLLGITKRLASDNNDQNTFRDSTYMSVTGGGGGSSASLAFLTDSQENRAQRSACGKLMRQLGLLDTKDIVLTMHQSGNLYRALDLTVDLVEYSGASALPAGHLTPPEELSSIATRFGATVLAGDTSQIINFASYIDAHGLRESHNFKTIFHTSETMTALQRAYIESIFARSDNTPLKFISVFGSAEMGVWAVANSDLHSMSPESASQDCPAAHTDFIFDTRTMIVECLPLSTSLASETRTHPCCISEGIPGLLAVTSLQRLRNPLLRYVTGDIASVHALPEHVRAKIGAGSEHLRVLRLVGRDVRSSFSWEGEYFEFAVLKPLFENPAWGVLRWQVVLGRDVRHPACESLEVRIMRAERKNDGVGLLLSEEELRVEMKKIFWVHDRYEFLFRLRICEGDEFVRSKTGNKVLMFVDRRGKLN